MSTEIQPTILKFPTGQAVNGVPEQTQSTQQTSQANPLLAALQDAATLVQARANATTSNVNAQSAAQSTKALHQAVPLSSEVFLQEFRAAVQASPQSTFDGAGTYDPLEQKLLALVSDLVDKEPATINLNLSDKPGAEEVLKKVQEGLGALPAPYKELVTETVVKALKDNPEARGDFENLIRFAKASTAILAEAKKANLSEADTAKLTNLLKQAQPFEGVFGVLVANTFDAAKKLDIEALVNIFRDCGKSLGDIVGEHTPKGHSIDPLQVLEQIQVPMANALPSVAQKVVSGAVDYVEKNALPLSKVFANAFAALTTVTNRLKAIGEPIQALGLNNLLNISPEKAAKASSN